MYGAFAFVKGLCGYEACSVLPPAFRKTGAVLPCWHYERGLCCKAEVTKLKEVVLDIQLHIADPVCCAHNNIILLCTLIHCVWKGQGYSQILPDACGYLCLKLCLLCLAAYPVERLSVKTGCGTAVMAVGAVQLYLDLTDLYRACIIGYQRRSGVCSSSNSTDKANPQHSIFCSFHCSLL